jgi:hypothetical protein
VQRLGVLLIEGDRFADQREPFTNLAAFGWRRPAQQLVRLRSRR